VDSNELIQIAEQKLKPYQTEDGRLHGDVAAAVLSKNGKIYTGVCVDTAGWGLCAERSAIASMITDGCYQIESVVAVWRDDKTNKLYVLPPCGICRDFMQNSDKSNLKANIILGRKELKKLGELLPCHEWPDPLEQ
jgi:cytidine deaminase